jgi:hypothetical protein
MISDDDAIEFDPDEPVDFEDKVAARVSSYTKLMALVLHVEDKELRKEGMMMLVAIRRSFKTLPTGELTALTGGKDSSDVSDNSDL